MAHEFDSSHLFSFFFWESWVLEKLTNILTYWSFPAMEITAFDQICLLRNMISSGNLIYDGNEKAILNEMTKLRIGIRKPMTYLNRSSFDIIQSIMRSKCLSIDLIHAQWINHHHHLDIITTKITSLKMNEFFFWLEIASSLHISPPLNRIVRPNLLPRNNFRL